jgi:hypothetical protein
MVCDLAISRAAPKVLSTHNVVVLTFPSQIKHLLPHETAKKQQLLDLSNLQAV